LLKEPLIDFGIANLNLDLFWEALPFFRNGGLLTPSDITTKELATFFVLDNDKGVLWHVGDSDVNTLKDRIAGGSSAALLASVNHHVGFGAAAGALNILNLNRLDVFTVGACSELLTTHCDTTRETCWSRSGFRRDDV
jgi:hypothetical protein